MRKLLNIHRLLILSLLFPCCFMISSCKKDAVKGDAVNTVKDVDGNVYHTVTIGTQVWMVENLKVTRYRNGEKIDLYPDKQLISKATGKGAYCDYEDKPENSKVYGRFYNHEAVHDYRQIAPIGWHIPTNQEWRTLIDMLGGINVAGSKMKEKGTIHWADPNSDADNNSGFTALPAGWCGRNGSEAKSTQGNYWGFDSRNPSVIRLSYADSKVDLLTAYQMAFSVRCIKD